MEDKQLQAEMLCLLAALERANDAVGDTPTRHRISELVVETRKVVKNGYPRARDTKPDLRELVAALLPYAENAILDDLNAGGVGMGPELELLNKARAVVGDQ